MMLDNTGTYPLSPLSATRSSSMPMSALSRSASSKDMLMMHNTTIPPLSRSASASNLSKRKPVRTLSPIFGSSQGSPLPGLSRSQALLTSSSCEKDRLAKCRRKLKALFQLTDPLEPCTYAVFEPMGGEGAKLARTLQARFDATIMVLCERCPGAAWSRIKAFLCERAYDETLHRLKTALTQLVSIREETQRQYGIINISSLSTLESWIGTVRRAIPHVCFLRERCERDSMNAADMESQRFMNAADMECQRLRDAYRCAQEKLCSFDFSWSAFNERVAALKSHTSNAELSNVIERTTAILDRMFPPSANKLDSECTPFDGGHLQVTAGGFVHPRHFSLSCFFETSYSPATSAEQELWQIVKRTMNMMVEEIKHAARAADTKLVHESWTATRVGEVWKSVSPDPYKIEVSEHHGLRPGDDIIIGGTLNRVRALGSVITYYQVTWSETESCDISVMSICPVVPSQDALDGKTMNFIENVETWDEQEHDSQLEKLLQDKKPQYDIDKFKHMDRKRERKEEIVRIYSDEWLFPSANKSMFMDNADELKLHAPYIRELRDVFLKGQSGDMIVEPFCGRVSRRANLPIEVVKEHVERFNEKDKIVWWSAFNSSAEKQYGGDGTQGNEHFGSVCFWIDVNPGNAEIKHGQYFPASIKKYSYFETENEVLLPPHTKFRITQVEDNLDKISVPDTTAIIWMETCELPSVWQLCQNQEWADFAEWAEKHPDMMDTRGKNFSIITTVSKNISEEPHLGVPNPLGVCIKHGANVNEIDPETGCTPLSLVAQTLKAQSLSTDTKSDLSESIGLLLDKGANPELGKLPMIEILPNYNFSADQIAADRIHWMYWIEPDNQHGEKEGWHPYNATANVKVEATFQQWMKEKKEAFNMLLSVKSGYFQYDVDFTQMHQVNLETGKRRRIRRHIQDMAGVVEFSD